jgi:hypothetical protein
MIFPVKLATGIRFTGRTNVSSTLSRLMYCQTGNACKSATVSESTAFMFSIIIRGIIANHRVVELRAMLSVERSRVVRKIALHLLTSRFA